MLANKFKSGLTYALILVAGLGIGLATPQLFKAFKPAYSTGDYSAYYPDANTRVVLYGTETCPYCIQARAYLRERAIPFIDRNVDSSDQGRRDFASLGKQAVPVILVGDRLLTGFNKKHLDAALDQVGYSDAR
ncbi:glutaredoxin family protein [Massilia aurea]|uniref:glutaredoxin family protein n=1 Tax=Massilia aurea TaxID=373040 RepID=UPI000F2DDA7C|nr:glutaredoxin family protein [Massilia aurea]